MLGDLAIRYDSRDVTVRGETVELTATEYELLRLLSVNAGRVVSFDTLLRRIWEGRERADANLVRIAVAGCGASSATAPTTPRGSSASAASATACQGPPRPEYAGFAASDVEAESNHDEPGTVHRAAAPVSPLNALLLRY